MPKGWLRSGENIAGKERRDSEMRSVESSRCLSLTSSRCLKATPLRVRG
jgi:hypothetical protein